MNPLINEKDNFEYYTTEDEFGKPVNKLRRKDSPKKGRGKSAAKVPGLSSGSSRARKIGKGSSSSKGKRVIRKGSSSSRGRPAVARKSD